jgi:hypothetical protein
VVRPSSRSSWAGKQPRSARAGCIVGLVVGLPRSSGGSQRRTAPLPLSSPPFLVGASSCSCRSGWTRDDPATVQQRPASGSSRPRAAAAVREAFAVADPPCAVREGGSERVSELRPGPCAVVLPGRQDEVLLLLRGCARFPPAVEDRSDRPAGCMRLIRELRLPATVQLRHDRGDLNRRSAHEEQVVASGASSSRRDGSWSRRPPARLIPRGRGESTPGGTREILG